MMRSVLAALAAAALAVSAACSSLSKEDETTGWSAQRLYGEAKDAMASREWQKAIKYLEKLEARYPYGRFAQQAQIEVAYAYYKQGETAQCISALEKFVKLHPNHPNIDYALYLKGLANFKEDLGPFQAMAKQDLADRDPKAARESFETFKDLITRYPENRYSNDARERMIYLVEALARHEIHVARWYIMRGAYLAAANRAQDAIVRFPNSPTHKDALLVLVESYDRMGMADLRDDAKKVLAKNFPDAGQAPTSKSWWKFW